MKFFHSRCGGFCVAMVCLLVSFGLAAFSGVTTNVGAGIWSSVASVAFGVEGIIVFYSVVVAGK